MNFDLIVENIPRFLSGLVVTLELTVASCVLGFALAVPLALMRLSPHRRWRWPATAYVLFVRGTPLLAQIFLIYYGSGQFVPALKAVGLWTFFREPWFCALLTLTLNTAAYTGEILRGAIAGVPKGEIEAARACGMPRRLRFRRIVLPRALGLAWPAYTNEIVYQLQATSLVSIITLMDITGVARVIASRDFAFYEAFLTAAAFYLVLVYGVLFVARRVERRLLAHLRPREAQPTQRGFGFGFGR
ncbi:ABC transporter permease [Rhodospirillaceae bacterium SYSU D60014]|uniref:ABC transporter permease n=1 Tax=Virgifigura deserti TaxID=2268457 RepID=UPI000E671DF4